MKFIFLLATFLCALPLAGAEEKTSMVNMKSTPFASATFNEGVFTFTLTKKWLSKRGDLKAELVRPEQKQVLKKNEEILIYERHTKIVIRNDGKGVVSLITTFDGRSFGSELTTKKEVLDTASVEPVSK